MIAIMQLVEFIVEVVTVTASGALSPGPLTFAIMSEGAKKGWKAGLYAAFGHAAVEFPLVILLALGLAGLFRDEFTRRVLGLVGGVSLIVYSALQLVEVRKLWGKALEFKGKGGGRGGFLTGVILSAFNPFFLLWWATVGAKLVIDALSVLQPLLLSVVVFYASHVWMDVVWLPVVALAGYKGSRISGKALSLVLLVLSVALIYYGVVFIVAALT